MEKYKKTKNYSTKSEYFDESVEFKKKDEKKTPLTFYRAKAM